MSCLCAVHSAHRERKTKIEMIPLIYFASNIMKLNMFPTTRPSLYSFKHDIPLQNVFVYMWLGLCKCVCVSVHALV